MAEVANTNAARVAALHLETIQRDGLTVSYSGGDEEEATFYADEAAAAVAWYRRTLPWDGSIDMAVLNAADYRRTTPIPFPSPHTELATRFIIIADHVRVPPRLRSLGDRRPGH